MTPPLPSLNQIPRTVLNSWISGSQYYREKGMQLREITLSSRVTDRSDHADVVLRHVHVIYASLNSYFYKMIKVGCQFYISEKPYRYRRRDIATLLNHL